MTERELVLAWMGLLLVAGTLLVRAMRDGLPAGFIVAVGALFCAALDEFLTLVNTFPP